MPTVYDMRDFGGNFHLAVRSDLTKHCDDDMRNFHLVVQCVLLMRAVVSDMTGSGSKELPKHKET